MATMSNTAKLNTWRAKLWWRGHFRSVVIPQFKDTQPVKYTLEDSQSRRKALIQVKMDELTELLDKVKSKVQKRDKKNKKHFSLEWQLGMGRSTSALGATAFETPHNFKKGVGVCMSDILDSKRPKWQKELYAKAKELILLIDADFAKNDDFVVNFSCMCDALNHYCRRHVDNMDIEYQYATVLGDCAGGDLTVWNSDGTSQTKNYHRKVLKMDGRLPHQVEPFTGRRYCVIFYKLYDRRYTEASPIFEPACFV